MCSDNKGGTADFIQNKKYINPSLIRTGFLVKVAETKVRILPLALMKTVGIIGGLGPETTAIFYQQLIVACFKQNKNTRPPILMWSIPIGFKIESNFITKNQDGEKYVLLLIEGARKLERAGADFLVIPCNSVHIFIKEIRKSVKIPVLSIVEETTNFLVSQNITKIGVLATPSTIQNKIYDQFLEKRGIQIILPDKEDQILVGKLIEKIVLNINNDREKKLIIEIIGKLNRNGAENVLLACTDLQLIVPQKSISNIIDSMEILLKSAVKKILDFGLISMLISIIWMKYRTF